MAKFASPEVVGASSAVVTLATLLTAVASIGVPSGVQRFLGKSFAENNISETKTTILGALLLTIAGICCSIVLLYSLKNWFFTMFELEENLFYIAIILTCFSTLNTLLRAVIISSLITKLLPIFVIVSSFSKLALSFVLVYYGLGALGLTIGFTSHHVMSTIFFTISMLALLNFKGINYHKLGNTIRDLLYRVCRNWIPLLIITIGTQIGTLVVFGSAGSKEAGVYFMDLTLVTGITSVAFSILTIALPAASAIKTGRKRLILEFNKNEYYSCGPIILFDLFLCQ